MGIDVCRTVAWIITMVVVGVSAGSALAGTNCVCNDYCSYDSVQGRIECDNFSVWPTEAYVITNSTGTAVEVHGYTDWPIDVFFICSWSFRMSGNKNIKIATDDTADLIYLDGTKSDDFSTECPNYFRGFTPASSSRVCAEVYTYDGSDTIHGGDETTCSGTYDDRLYGGDGVDYIYGNSGVDYIDGGDDGDYIWGGGSGDVIYGDEGADVIRAGTGDDLVSGGPGDDTIYGWTGDDELFGDQDDDTIYGESGTNDVVCGGGGTNTLNGGGGLNDACYHCSAYGGSDSCSSCEIFSSGPCT